MHRPSSPTYHEAAHAVVGLSLGLTIFSATLTHNSGSIIWEGTDDELAWCITCAAGPAYEMRARGRIKTPTEETLVSWGCKADLDWIKPSKLELGTLIRAASGILHEQARFYERMIGVFEHFGVLDLEDLNQVARRAKVRST